MTKYLPALGMGVVLGASAMLAVWLTWEATKAPCPCEENQ